MTNEANIERILVVLSPDLIRPDEPMKSALIQRAISLSRITGCELELFHVCYDSRLDYSLFTSDEEFERAREHLTDKDATRLAELAARLSDESANVRYEVRWDYPRTDAILRKIAEARPDVVMKQAREQSYFLGLGTNTDWELSRRSPAHVWLVNDDVNGIERVLAAVGNKFGDPADITTTVDYDLLQTAGSIGDTLKAAVHTVNAFQLASALPFAPHLAEVAVAPTELQHDLRRQTEEQHNAAVKALAKHFNIPMDNVHIREGHPNKVIPNVAKAVNADLIILGAKSIGRLERFLGSVTVEPVIAESNCDTLIVRDRDMSGVPDTASSPVYGVPKYDLEKAVVDPEGTFESPQQVANVSEISIALRRRILEAWEYDIRAEMDEENEGGAIRDIDVNALDKIVSAKAFLDMKQGRNGPDAVRLGGSTA